MNLEKINELTAQDMAGVNAQSWSNSTLMFS
jgi:hypothetical protein